MEGAFRRDILVSGAFIAASIAVFGGGLYWLSIDVARQGAKVVEERALITEHTRLLEALARLKTISPEIQSYEGKINALLPAKDELLDLPRWFETLARVNRVSLNFTFQGSAAAAEGDEPGHISFVLIASAPIYSDLETFLKEVEVRSPRFLVGLHTFDFNRTDGGYRAVAQGRAYFR